MASSNFVTALTTTRVNLMSGDINEFIPFRARVTVYMNSSTAIATTQALISIFADSDVVCERKAVLTNGGTSLVKPDGLLVSFLVEEGTKLSVFAQTDTGTSTLLSSIEIDRV